MPVTYTLNQRRKVTFITVKTPNPEAGKSVTFERATFFPGPVSNNMVKPAGLDADPIYSDLAPKLFTVEPTWTAKTASKINTQQNAVGGATDGIDLSDIIDTTETGADPDEQLKDTGVFDLNTATKDELESIHGIGPATAQKILDLRSQVPFTDMENAKERLNLSATVWAEVSPFLKVETSGTV